MSGSAPTCRRALWSASRRGGNRLLLLMAGAAVLGRKFGHGAAFGARAMSQRGVGGSARLSRRASEAGHELGMDQMIVSPRAGARRGDSTSRALAGAALAAVSPIRGCLAGGAVWPCSWPSSRDKPMAQQPCFVSRANGHAEPRACPSEAGRRGPPRGREHSAGRVQLFAAGRFERARELGERLSYALRGEAEQARVHLAETALIRVDWGTRRQAARDRAGLAASERLELVAASIALGRYRYTEAEPIARGGAARAAARGDDQTACEAWRPRGESTAADTQCLSGAGTAERRPMAPPARARAALGSLDVLRVGSSERVSRSRARRHCGARGSVNA